MIQACISSQKSYCGFFKPYKRFSVTMAWKILMTATADAYEYTVQRLSLDVRWTVVRVNNFKNYKILMQWGEILQSGTCNIITGLDRAELFLREMDMTQNCVQWLALVIMIQYISYKVGNILTNWVTTTFSTWISMHGDGIISSGLWIASVGHNST
jgi:hypothetical protein